MVASVHLDTSRDAEDADKKIELRWRALRRLLEEDGADRPTLDAIETAIGDSPHVVGPQGEALFARGGDLLGMHIMSRPPSRDHAAWLPVPDPLDLVVDRDHQLSYVTVAIDREGADIDAYAAYSHDPVAEESVDGGTLHISKVRAGGPSQKHYHRRSENLWNDNAAQVAVDVQGAVAEVDPAVIFVGGDARATGMLRTHLERMSLGSLVEVVSGGRADDGAAQSLRVAVDRARDVAMIASHDAVLRSFAARVPQGSAVEGPQATMRALSEGMVETLLLGAEREGEPDLWASASAPLLIIEDRAGLPEPESGFKAPASALMLRSAVLSDATFTELLEHGTATDGTGATLRYTRS
jgi:hypothetical protein